MNKYLIIDGSSILFRAYYALPTMQTKNGEHTNALVGFMNILLKAIEEIEPTNIAVCFDLKEKTFRSDLYDQYKANRTAAPEDLSEQFTYIKEILSGFNINYFELGGFEADDLAGTLAQDASQKGFNVYLLSGDKDYLQLIDENTKFLYTKTGMSDIKVYDLETLNEEMGLTPDQIIDLKALMGDKSDNIPGIPGVGEKTALKLLKEFKNVENLYLNKDSLPNNKTNQKIKDNEEIAMLSKSLAKIDRDAPLELNKIDTSVSEYNEELLFNILSRFELNSLIKRFQLTGSKEFNIEATEKNIIYNIELNKLIEKIKGNKDFNFKILSNNKSYNNGKIFKIGIGILDDIYILDVDDNFLIDLKEVFESEEVTKSGYEIKDEIIYLKSLDIDLNNYIQDISISEYLLNPTDSDYTLDKLSLTYNIVLEENFPDKKLLKKPIDTWDEINQNDYLISILWIVEKVKNIQLEKLKSENMLELFESIELPLTKVLADMEYTGVYVDKNALFEIGKDLDSELETLVSEIYRLAGEEFNINSPKQLGEILFTKLDLPPIKKTKTGYSTNIDVLEKLEDKHEIISYIIRYRTISKLKSTYVDGLTEFINPYTGRIHSNFKQNVAATGRLSSIDPNLQNIPVKTEEGRQLRKIFISKDKNHQLVDADYSQIELRLLADISIDENMLNSFKNNVDIHSTTASKVFHVDLDEVTPLMRSRAKAVNFGIVYGVSDYGLSQNLRIPRKEAKEYIDNYLKQFSGVNSYMKNIVESAKEKGYVETKFGRKRYLPELASRNKNVRNFGERIALNMPIQGTAADIIKIAMIRVYNSLKNKKLKSKLILQIHDELIIESPMDELEMVKDILKTEMENSVNLRVPLTVDLETGASWYETK